MMNALTEKQKNILDFIDDFQEKNGVPPTVQEIADHFAVKSSTVFAHLRALQRKKEISRTSKARSISLLNHQRTLSNMPSGIWTIPLLGQISAGEPAESVSLNGEEYQVPAGIGGCTDKNRLFALQVSGESMRDLGIYAGDIVVVQQLDSLPSPGDIVAAVIPGGECTVKSYFPHDQHSIELRPANPDYQVQIHRKDQVQFQGKVVALHRKY
ncbi:MAG: repressor LexA [Lentisphaeria bacterium]|nr:repressor LexA [Lentisphaeria bacterium]